MYSNDEFAVTSLYENPRTPNDPTKVMTFANLLFKIVGNACGKTVDFNIVTHR